MKNLQFLTSLALLLTLNQAALAAPSAAMDCPQKGESSEDCPWAGISRALSALPKDASMERQKLLSAQAPELARQIQNDKAHSALFELWGESLNFDEGAKNIIIDPSILETIGRFAGTNVLHSGDAYDRREKSPYAVHAGLEHTYGYLFSNLVTPFGFKRARWVRPEVAENLGLPSTVLGPNTPKGTLFQNVTFTIGSIAFRNDPRELGILIKNCPPENLPAELAHFDFKRLEVTRLTESFSFQGKTFVLRTDFVTFPKATGSNTHWLIYSLVDPRESNLSARLISAFPVAAQFAERAMKPETLGRDRDIQVRYNAYLDKIPANGHKGSRSVSKGFAAQ